jgi:hypothetical protein
MQDELAQLRNEILGLFPWLETTLAVDLRTEQRDLLDRGREALTRSRYLVLTVGEFKRGKSTLLNALVEQKLFPVDVDVATSTVCTLSWGESAQALVHFLPVDETDVRPAPKTVDNSEVPRYVTEGGKVAGDAPVARVDMVAPVDSLRSGLVLVDTPGVGSLNPAHTAATSGFLPEADALLFVASAVQPLSTVELAFLTRAYEICPLVLTAVTMIDKTVDEQQVVAQARARIATVTGTPEQDVDLVAVSALRKWNGLRDGNQTLIDASGFPELERRLWTGLRDRCIVARLTWALDVLESVVADCETPLVHEQAGLAGQAALKDIDEQLKAAHGRAQQLKADLPRHSRMLTEELDERARPVRRQLIHMFENLETDFRQATEDRASLADPAVLLNRLVERVVDGQGRAKAELAKVAETVATAFSERLSIQLTGLGEEAPRSSLSLAAPHIDLPSQGFASFRTVWGGATAAGAAGVMAGALLAFVFPPAAAAIGPFLAGPLVGGIMGQLAGVVGGFGQAKRARQDREDAERRRRLREYVLPRIDSMRRASLDDFDQRLRDEAKALSRTMDDQLRSTIGSLEASRARLQEARVRTVAENEERLREVQRRLADYAGVYEALTATRRRIEGLGHG